MVLSPKGILDRVEWPKCAAIGWNDSICMVGDMKFGRTWRNYINASTRTTQRLAMAVWTHRARIIGFVGFSTPA